MRLWELPGSIHKKVNQLNKFGVNTLDLILKIQFSHQNIDFDTKYTPST
jgi:hypothetical protein